MFQLSSFQLKIIAMFFMVLDHIYTYLNGVSGISIPIWFGYLGKISAPIFFYLIVEGFFNTRNRTNYLLRLFGFGVLMIGVDLLLGIHNNIFLSLGLSVLLMSVIEYGRRSRKYVICVLLALLIAIVFMFTEASIYGLMMTLIFYFLRQHKGWMIISYLIYSVLPIFSALSLGADFLDAILLWDYQWMMVFSAPFLLLYSGKIGLHNQVVKWMFYIFYPLHLVMIILLSKVM